MPEGQQEQRAESARLVPGVRLLGEYQGSGFVEPRYLVARSDGQLLHVSRLLFLVASALRESVSPTSAAQQVSAAYGRTLTPDGLVLLVEHKLQPMGLACVDRPAHPRAAVPPAPGPPSAPALRSKPLLTLRFRRVLLSQGATRVVAAALAPLFTPVVVVALVGSLLATDTWLVRSASLDTAVADTLRTPPVMLLLLAILLGSTLFHEFGHAAACRYGGATPGAIGVALYVVYPAFYTDVTQSYRLGRAGRVRTDLGGVYFNAISALALTALYAQTAYAPLLLAIALVHLELVQQLLPLARLDGYFIVADLIGVPDLFSRVGPILSSLVPGRGASPRVRELRPAARAVVTIWVLTAVPVMVGLLAVLVWRVPSTARTIWASEVVQWHGLLAALSTVDPPGVLLALLSIVLLPLPLVGLGLLLVGVARRVLPLAVRLAGRPFHSSRGPKAAVPRSLEVTMSAPSSAPLPFPTETSAPMAQQAHQLEPSVPASPPPLERASATTPGPGPAPQPLAPHSAAEFTESAMLRHRARPAGRGWRRSLYAATRGAVNLGPGSDERRELELQERVSTPIRGSRRIVVISRKGGAGKTTTALMLGHTFASHRGDRVIALDANPDAGSLAHRMRRETARTVTDLLDQRNRIERYADMRGYTSQAADTRLEVVASDDDPRISQALGEEDYRTAIDLLDRHYNLILVDTGTGILDSAIKGILAEADQIVVVMPPALDGARVAAMTLDWLEEHDHADLVRGAVAVVNAVHGRGDLELERIDEHFVARCSAVVHIPWDITLQAGAHTTLGDLRRETRQAYLELAAAVAASFEGSVPAGTRAQRAGGTS